MRTVTMEVATAVNGSKVQTEFEVKLPRSLTEAVNKYGKVEVFRLVIDGLVRKAQSQARRDLKSREQAKQEFERSLK